MPEARSSFKKGEIFNKHSSVREPSELPALPEDLLSLVAEDSRAPDTYDAIQSPFYKGFSKSGLTPH